MADTVKFAIVGCGKLGSRHAEKIKNEVPGAEISDVFDVVPAAAQTLGQQYGAVHYADLGEMLKNSMADYVNICTPSGLHPAQAIQAMQAGKNVLVEKPLAFKAKDAEEMIATAKKTGRDLYVVKQNRYNAPIAFVKKLMDEGTLGEPFQCVVNVLWNRNNEYYGGWRGTKAGDGATVTSQVSHFIDLMVMFMGPAKRAFSLMDTKNHAIEIEDTGALAIEFKNKAVGTVNYSMNTATKNFEGSITLIFKNGTIKIGGEFLNKIEYFDVPGMEGTELPEEKAGRGGASNHDKIFKALVAKKNGVDDPLIKNLVTGEEALDGVKLMEAAIQSAETGMVVTIR
jgi:predicted dehydrogenase